MQRKSSVVKLASHLPIRPTPLRSARLRPCQTVSDLPGGGENRGQFSTPSSPEPPFNISCVKMGKIQKKGEKGAAANYITRSKAVRKLQISLAEFRRLCILKGVYPRVPKNKKKASGKNNNNNTFYYVKDINYLMHEPVLQKFRQKKVFLRKLYKAIGKQQYDVAKMLERNAPEYSLDHIIKERYPTFIDALRDLDDCLCHVFLFSSLPSSDEIDNKKIESCKRLAAEFQNYLVLTSSLKKTFLSIKGIYYQAEIQGQKITWLVPYQFTQKIPSDVDLKVMFTFLEFYETLLGFVNYQLYSNIKLKYPPSLNYKMEDSGAGYLASFSTEVLEFNENSDSLPAIEDNSAPNEKVGNGADKIFNGLSIFISREVPRFSVEFVLRAFGAKVCWSETSGEGSSLDEKSDQITHQIVDRPAESLRLVANRFYVQPQWIYDCVNAGKILETVDYEPGKKLPPHLSPFVEHDELTYNPMEDDFEKTSQTAEPQQMAEKKDLAKIMLSNRKRKLLENIEKGKSEKLIEKKRLKERKKSLGISK